LPVLYAMFARRSVARESDHQEVHDQT